MGLQAISPELQEKFGLRCCKAIQTQPVFRSRALSDISYDEINELHDLGIKVIYDLRKPAEQRIDPEPDGIVEQFKVISSTVDLQNDEHRTNKTMANNVSYNYGKPGERMRYLYGIMASYSDVIKKVAWQIYQAEAPVLVHCANGKDRVGVVCACVQLLNGASYETVLEDYLKTNTYNAAINKRDLAHYAGLMPASDVEVLAAMFEARKEYLDTFLKGIDKLYGSFDGWMYEKTPK